MITPQQILSNLKEIKHNDKISGIYCIYNIETNKCYIGQSINIYKRIIKHKSLLNKNKHDNKHLQNAWNLSGKFKFVFGIIETCPIEKLAEKEEYWLKSIDKNFKYNFMDCFYTFQETQRKKMQLAHLGRKMPERTIEHRKKLSEIHKGKPKTLESIRKGLETRLKNGTMKLKKEKIIKPKIAWNKGIPMTEEQKKNLSEKKKGIHLSNEHKIAIGKGNKGKKLSKETKEKMSNSMKNNPKKMNTIKAKKVCQLIWWIICLVKKLKFKVYLKNDKSPKLKNYKQNKLILQEYINNNKLV